MNHLSTTQLSEYLQVTKRTVQRRANRENWPFVVKKGLGGTRRMYAFASLPFEVRARVIGQIVAKHELQGVNYSKKKFAEKLIELPSNPFIVERTALERDWLSQHIFAAKFPYPIDDSEQDKDYIKVGLLVLAQLYVVSFSLGKIKGFDKFCELYSSRQLDLQPIVYQFVDKVSRITLLRWEKIMQQRGEKNLLVDVQSEEKCHLDRDLQVMAQELSAPKLTATRLRQHFLTIFAGRKLPNERQISIWLKQQKASLD